MLLPAENAFKDREEEGEVMRIKLHFIGGIGVRGGGSKNCKGCKFIAPGSGCKNKIKYAVAIFFAYPVDDVILQYL